jgi:hypothetical protein
MFIKNSFGEKLAHKIRKCPQLAASLYCFTLVAFNDDYFFTFPSKISYVGLAQIHIVCRVAGKGTRKNICCFLFPIILTLHCCTPKRFAGWVYTSFKLWLYIFRTVLHGHCTVRCCKLQTFSLHSPFHFFLQGLPLLSTHCCCVQSSALCAL